MSNISLGEKIRQIRKGLKLNQLEFANKLGFKSATAVSKFEDNSRTPDKNNLIEIAKLGKITLDELLTGSQSYIYKEEQGKNSLIKESASLDYVGKKIGNDFKITNAIKMCTYVLESETPYAVALYHNLVGFERAVKNELEHNTCKADLEKANKTVSEMRTRMDGMEEDLKKMKEEFKKLLEHSGGSAPIKLTMDHAAPTGTEDKER